jgi:hypothetical protein
MATPEMKRKLWSLAAFIVPLVAVKAASVVLVDGGPQQADANVPEAAKATANPGHKPVKFTEQQLAAQRHIASMHGKNFESNPLLYVGLEPEKPPTPVIEVPVVVIEPPKIEPPPAFQLQLVMSGVRGDTALIDGRPYRVGDRVRDTDWKVQTIEVAKRSASLAHISDGRTITIEVDLPLPRE